MIVLGHIGAVLIGISLALIGGGGSILTMPVLVYFFHIAPVEATGYSLFIVGITALAGSLRYARKKLLDFKTAFIFGIPSIIAVFLSRKYLVPALPEIIFESGNIIFTKDHFIMILFAVLMLASSVSMIRSGKFEEATDMSTPPGTLNITLIFIEGIIVGTLTGFVGAGGGFLIIPALVLLAKLPMKTAIGTSLLIIAAKSLIGFTGDISAGHYIDWRFLIIFSFFAIAGIAIGSYLSRYFSSQKLRPVFGWYVLIMGIYIISKEIFL